MHEQLFLPGLEPPTPRDLATPAGDVLPGRVNQLARSVWPLRPPPVPSEDPPGTEGWLILLGVMSMGSWFAWMLWLLSSVADLPTFAGLVCCMLVPPMLVLARRD
jgi:hypothetical protein